MLKYRVLFYIATLAFVAVVGHSFEGQHDAALQINGSPAMFTSIN